MAEYRLHCFAQSGNAYKAALMLNLCRADWEPRFVDFFNGETRTPAYRALNEMGEVPVLEHQNEAISQSGVILDYLSNRLGKFAATNDKERREVLRWVLFDNHKLTSYVATLRFLLQFTKQGETAVTEFLRGRAQGALRVLDGHLQAKKFAVGDSPTIADISMCGYLFWPDEIGVDLAPHKHVNRWLDAIKGLPGWVHPYDLMPGA